MNRKGWLLCLILLSVSATHAQTFNSGEVQVPLIELYTSEGCSSCPPADRWLARLSDHPDVWSGFVPVAFHVDYWDYIGWRDRFASREYSQRQRQYARQFGESTVYTPGVRKAGKEWRSWRRSLTPLTASGDNVGDLSVTVADDGTFTARFDQYAGDRLKFKSPILNIALLGSNLSSDVTRGENRGKTLRHSFVVLGLSRFAGSTDLRWTGSLPPPATGPAEYALAAWVSDGGDPTPIQSTGGRLSEAVQFTDTP